MAGLVWPIGLRIQRDFAVRLLEFALASIALDSNVTIRGDCKITHDEDDDPAGRKRGLGGQKQTQGESNPAEHAQSRNLPSPDHNG